MQTNNLILSPTTKRPFEHTKQKMTISEVFSERKYTYRNKLILFLAHFNNRLAEKKTK